MNFLQALTVLGTGVLTALPTVTTVLPPPFNIVATSLISMGGALWHLYQPIPGSK